MSMPTATEMAGIQSSFLSANAPLGDPRLMCHEGTQLAIALGVANEGVDVVLQDWTFVNAQDVCGQMVSIKGIMDAKCPPLPQIFWKDSPLNVFVILPVGDFSVVPSVFDKMCKELPIGMFNVLLLSDCDAPLFEGGMAFANQLPWKLEQIAKVHRQVATTNGTHLQAWFLASSEKSRLSGADPTFKITRLLSPGSEPRRLFVTVPTPPEDLVAISVPFGRVPDLLKSVDVAVDKAVVLPGPLARTHRWVMLRSLTAGQLQQLQEAFYDDPGFAICPYQVYKGSFDARATVIQIFWRKALRSQENLQILWRMVHFQLKEKQGQLQDPPLLQWVGANKLRLALGRQEDVMVFLQSILPLLKQRGLVCKNEKTGEFLDEDGIASVSGFSSTSSVSSSTMGYIVEAVVISDLPDFFLPLDVESVVRSALKCRQVVGAEAIPLSVKKLEWSMGSPMCPTWQVAGKGVSCLESNILNFDLDGQPGMAMVLPWKEYATARAAWRARAQGTGTGSQRQVPGGLELAPQQKAQQPPPPLPVSGDQAMDVDVAENRGKRNRHDLSE